MENSLNFRDIETIKPTYYNSEDDPINDFLIPVLKRTKIYKRLTYSFSSAFFSIINDALIDIIKNDCKIYCIAGIEIDPPDVQAIEDGLIDEEGFIEKKILEEFGKIEELIKTLSKSYGIDIMDHRLKVLSYLVSKGIFNIKIGFVRIDKKIVNPGKYKFHPKVMIFIDGRGNIIATNGSPNESYSALAFNQETIDVYTSWNNETPDPHLETHVRRFEQFWNNKSENIRAIDINKLLENKILLKYRSYNKKEDVIEAEKKLNELLDQEKESFGLWSHQDKAKKIFLKEKKGILEMATGTGKTRVAINILNELYKENKIDGAIITLFGTNLLDQWHRELCKDAKDFTIYRQYENYREASSYSINHKSSILLISKDFIGNFLRTNKSLTNKKIFIFDEVHRMGSTEAISTLKDKLSLFPYKLGLSATPERAYDEEGNKFIEEELGPVLFRFSLEDAIKKGILCEFDYIPLYYEYDEEDKQKRKAAYAWYECNKETNPLLKKEELYKRLSRIKKLSKSKIPVFEDYLIANKEILDRSILFVEEKEYGEMIQRILIKYMSDYQTFYAEDQKENLHLFSECKINSLLTCKRLSEGIDVRSINNIILFSTSRAKLETIQRMGRCLRIDPNNSNKRAKIIDFIVKSDLENEDNKFEKADEERYKWLKELSKVKKEGD